MRLPIVAGRLRGQWWHAESGGKTLRVLTGRYEPEQTALFEQFITPGAAVLDVGAHVGYYTLLSAALAGPGGSVLAFEPNPRNCAFLRRHVALNRLDNVRVEEAAVTDANGTAEFEFGTGSGTGHIAKDGSGSRTGHTVQDDTGSDTGPVAHPGTVTVRTLRLDDVCRERGITPAAIKIDVEGAELRVLTGAEDVIARARPVIFLSTHGADVHRECMTWLAARGYELEPILGTDAAHDTELLCRPRET